MPSVPRRATLRLAALALVGAWPAAAADPHGKRAAAAPRYADSEGCPDTAFHIVNLSVSPVREVYLRPSGRIGSFGEDRLGEKLLRTGARLRLDPGIGLVDLLLLRADGRAFAALRQDPCAISEVRLEADDRLAIR